MNMRINQFICKGFQIHPEILKSSQMDIHSFREERVIDICLQAGGTEYLSGNGARAYQKEEDFQAKVLKLTYQAYQPIRYRQLWGEFQPCMSVLDYLFNCGFDWDYVEEQVRLAQQS